MKYWFTISLALLICHFQSKAQLLVDKIIPPSPDAAAIMKYCDHPLGKNTGLQEIEIPIHTLSVADIKVPINLKYHPIGIKVEEEASWTGLGWHLNSGGVITRLVRGKNDIGIVEKDLGSVALGYPFEHLKPCLDDCPEKETMEFRESVCNGLVDTDPDIFFYNISGNYGKFLMTPNHDTHTKSVSIELNANPGMTANFMMESNSWEVKAGDGTVYYFRAREVTETQRNYFDYMYDSHNLLMEYYSDIATTSWYMSEIVSPTGARIYFDYDVDANGKSPYGSVGAHTRMNINDHNTWDVHYSHYCFPEVENVQILAENIYNNVYLKKIRYGDNSVEFFTSDRTDMVSHLKDSREREGKRLKLNVTREPQKLDRILINEGGSSKEVRFNYTYFNESASESPKLHKRLKLKEIFMPDDQITLDYSEQFSLPSKESHARDLWGYYNGEEDIRNVTPSDFFNYNQPERLLEIKGRNKHFSEKHEMSGLLTKMQYANGSAVTYQYESQDYHYISDDILSYYNEQDSENFEQITDPFVSGGLRVKAVTKSVNGKTTTYNYNYSKNGNSSGRLSITPFNHTHSLIGHKSAGNHHIYYENVQVTTN